MDIGTIIVVLLGILFFFGGAMWLEMRSRKNKRAWEQGARPGDGGGRDG